MSARLKHYNLSWRMAARAMLAVMLFITAWLTGLSGLHAETVANFDGGTSAVPDAYLGVVGDGWNSPWAENIRSDSPNTTTNNTVPSTGSPVVDGGNFLSVEVIPGASDTEGSRYGVGRDFSGGVDQTQPYRIEFTYRIDEDLDSTETTFADYHDRYSIAEGTSAYNDTTASNSWSIFGMGGTGAHSHEGCVKQWAFYDGDNNGSFDGDNPNKMISTGIALTTGGVYQFTIDVYPNEDISLCYWNATVNDGTNSFTSTNMGFRTDDGVGSYLNFLTKKSKATAVEGEDVRQFSVDGIRISAVPEPSVALLLTSGGVLLLTFYRRRYRTR